MEKRILDFLKKRESYISGEEISHSLGISRSAIWKHIQGLRQLGYDIVAVPHLGYRLLTIPDRLFPSEVSENLRTKFVGRKIHYYDTLASTMDAATELGMKGCPEGTIVIAEAQTKGRGRLGRSWLSPKYKGIYFSLILKPKISPNQAPILTLLAVVSVCEAIKEISGLDARIKWPNDILINHKKLGGILTELNAEMDEIRFVVIGIGLNVNNDKKSLITGATSLKEERKENTDRIILLKKLLKKLEGNYRHFPKESQPKITEKWRSLSFTLGKRVKIISHHKQLEGVAVDIDVDGGLLLRNDSGLVQKVMAGDVVHCK
jgi:BirA family biotin operon repressor/biotin-[acetyl-CoA-carboxylase] ligase